MQPAVQGTVVLEARIANHQHLDRCVVHVGVVGIGISGSTSHQHIDVEDLVVDAYESRAESVFEHLFRAFSITILEVDVHLDVVEHLYGASSGVVADGLHDESTERDATHGAKHLDHGNRIVVVTVARVGGLAESVFHRTRINVLSDWCLHGSDRANAIVAQSVLSFGMAAHRNNRCRSRGNGDKPCEHRQLRLTDVTVRIGAFDVDFRELTTCSLDFASAKAGKRERSLEARHVALHAFGLVDRTQLNALLCHDAYTKHHSEENKSYFFHFV